jgi:transposase-like protein
MQEYISTTEPNVSDTWRADELYLKVKGDMKYLFAVMDDETRYWIAQEVSNVKQGANADRLFMKAKNVAGKAPETIITDALPSYMMAAGLNYPHATHIREIAFAGGIHNNKMERMNGEIRDREKTMRGLKVTDTPILGGMQIYHNFVRPHQGLNGDTPADRAGIRVEGTDKFMTLIQNAQHQRVIDNGIIVLPD